MKFYLLLSVFVCCCFTLRSQCPGMALSELHQLQRASLDQKESTIQALGFDLRSQFTMQGTAVRSFSKCWNSNWKGQAVFEQLVWWLPNSNALIFMTLNEGHYKQLRKSIVSRRRTEKEVTENPDFYIGRLFHYRFGGRRVDGIDYFFVKISFKQ